MIKPTLVFDTAFLESLSAEIQNVPKTLTTVIGKSLLPTVREKALGVLRQEPGRVVYPIEWKSIKQRRAYFASRGFGQGIPYQRTGSLVNAWDVVLNRTSDYSGEIRAENDNPAARFVIGADQQPFHHNTGWYVTDEKIPAINAYANDALIDAWHSVATFEYE